MAKKIGVLLSGCGVYDGSEIHEAVLALLALDRAGVEIACMAPNKAQMHVVDHVTGRPAGGETRNVLVESARIARGAIRDVATVRGAEFDALILPGGFGAAKNLSDYATRGAACTVDAEAARLIREMHEAGKPLGFICIAPVIAAALLGTKKVHLTIGSDAATASDIQTLGAVHEACTAQEICVDRALRVVSTPAYMLGKGISEVADGIERLVKEVLAMA